MAPTKPVMKMPELLVFARWLALGFLGAEVIRITFYLGTTYAQTLPLLGKTILVLIGLLLCSIYSVKRGAAGSAARMGRSLRFDLLAAIGIGIWMNDIASLLLADVHAIFQNSDPQWAAALLLLLGILLLSPLLQHYWPRPEKIASQLYFISDEEINDEKEDLLTIETQAKSFAETVLTSNARQGLVFGIDGPWGIGKTSFINLANHYWSKAKDKIIVCRFEPLRYASEPDLSDRLIRDVSTAIQKHVFAPELRPTVSRYSRLIKGKADVSFFGFKLSLEPSQETIDELLDDIDDVLKRINRRVIIVIDDLDRLDAKTTNNVLFATRRTFKLSQATYILCYDTEVLVGSKEEGSRAREFLEKFVTVKLSLFVDSSSIGDFLRRDWQRHENELSLIPSDTMVKLGSVLNELADILDSELAANYLPLVGNLRKVKRFVNAMLLMQIEKSDLERTDFNKRDLIHLILIHLNYPGLFRRIYAEETEDRSGIFSVNREYGEPEFKNSDEFGKLLKEQTKQQPAAAFLLKQLFDVKTLELDNHSDVEEMVMASRACFNQDPFRNLERYLKLIVRFTTPEPQETFVLYQDAVGQVRNGASIASVLASSEFQLEREYGEHAHDQFWRVLVNQSYDFTAVVAEDAINTLINYLPHYSSVKSGDRGLRHRSIYSLILLLDRAGWGRTSGRRLPNTTQNVIEIAWRIFGEQPYEGKGLLQRLASSERGVLGWNDLMLFRLQCSADRGGQVYNLHSALIVHQDRNAETTGLVSKLALLGMRKLSQEVFALFKKTYIDPRRNFLAEVSDTSIEDFFGQSSSQYSEQALENSGADKFIESVSHQISTARSSVKTFVIYQLSNRLPPNGSGVGCGYYDESGTCDSGNIARLMNEYMFGVCFNPDFSEDNVLHFLDYCLSHLSSSFFIGGDEEGYVASKAELSGGLDPKEMGRYWSQHQKLIRLRVTKIEVRYVFTLNYRASYGEHLDGVFAVLDELANEVNALDVQSDKLTPVGAS